MGILIKVIEGRFEQFVKDLHWEKSDTTGYTHVTTTISKWDTTFEPGVKASSIHARASRKETDIKTYILLLGTHYVTLHIFMSNLTGYINKKGIV